MIIEKRYNAQSITDNHIVTAGEAAMASMALVFDTNPAYPMGSTTLVGAIPQWRNHWDLKLYMLEMEVKSVTNNLIRAGVQVTLLGLMENSLFAISGSGIQSAHNSSLRFISEEGLFLERGFGGLFWLGALATGDTIWTVAIYERVFNGK